MMTVLVVLGILTLIVSIRHETFIHDGHSTLHIHYFL